MNVARLTLGVRATSVSSLGVLTRQAVDQTGLSGRFDFTVEFNPERKGPPPRQTRNLTTFSQRRFRKRCRQLGLKLKATRAPVDTLVIDRGELPSET